jgi:ATP-dependent RNA helicase DDX19/DBP5
MDHVTQTNQTNKPNKPNKLLLFTFCFCILNRQDDVIKGLYNKKFDRPSRIQEHALPLLLKNPPEHLVGQAQSGTGKTAAFCLAILARLDYDDPDCQVNNISQEG